MTPQTATLVDHAPSAETVRLLPTPRQLAQLGTVLCLYRQATGGGLAGWSQAVRAEADVELDSDGMRESLLFYDRADRCCWRLYLLPDSDFLAWEGLVSMMPPNTVARAPLGVGERLLRRLARSPGDRWAGSILRLHALGADPAREVEPPAVLAASLALISPLGAGIARRIAHSQGAQAASLEDACCCERAARAATRASGAVGTHASTGLDSPLQPTGTQA